MTATVLGAYRGAKPAGFAHVQSSVLHSTYADPRPCNVLIRRRRRGMIGR
jgi:hypothetical protein